MPISSLFQRLSRRSRELKMRLLNEHLPIGPTDRVLDIGGELDGRAQQLLERLPDKSRLVAVNILHNHLARIRSAYSEVVSVQASATDLPFADGAFDFVYSNAVLEHVGDLQAQARMAAEVRRVGKRWFLTTPNRWYPFEFHVRMPLVSWLPAKWMHKVAYQWGYDHGQQRYRRGCDYSDVRLLTARQLRAMFPDSLVLKPRITFWPETLVVVGPVGKDGTLPAATHFERAQPRAAQAASA